MTSPPTEPTGSTDGRAVDEAVEAIVPFAGFAAFACWLDVAFDRGLLRVVGATAGRQTAFAVEVASRFVRNVAAVACLFGLLWATRTTLRHSGLAFGILRRMTVGGLLGILLPVLTIALFLPEPSTTMLLLLVGFAATHALAMTYGGSAFVEESPIEQRVACALTFAMAVLNLLSLIAEYMGAERPELAHNLRNVAEISFFALPISVTLGLALRKDAKIQRSRGIAALLVGLAVAVVLRLVAQKVPALMNLLLYSMLRLSALEAAPPFVYALLVGTTLGAALVVAASNAPTDRRLGIGLLLVGAAGAGPRSVLTLASLALGAALLGLVSSRHPAEDAATAAAEG